MTDKPKDESKPDYAALRAQLRRDKSDLLTDILLRNKATSSASPTRSRE